MLIIPAVIFASIRALDIYAAIGVTVIVGLFCVIPLHTVAYLIKMKVEEERDDGVRGCGVGTFLLIFVPK